MTITAFQGWLNALLQRQKAATCLQALDVFRAAGLIVTATQDVGPVGAPTAHAVEVVSRTTSRRCTVFLAPGRPVVTRVVEQPAEDVVGVVS